MTTDAPDIFGSGFSFNTITGRILLGSKPENAAHLDKIRAAGVTHIVDVCEVDDSALWTPQRPAWLHGYLFNPTLDDQKPKPVGWFQTIARFVMPLIAAPGNVIYFHCESGMSRSAVAVYYTLRCLGLTETEAYLMIKAHRPIALWGYIPSAESALIQGW